MSRQIASDWAVRKTLALSLPTDRAFAQHSLAKRSPSPCSRATVAPPEGEVKRPARPAPLGRAQKKVAIPSPVG